MLTYAVVTLTPRDRYKPQLLSSHLDQFGAWSSYRSAPKPGVLVVLQGVQVEDFEILGSKGIEPSGLEADPLFLDAIRRAVT